MESLKDSKRIKTTTRIYVAFNFNNIQERDQVQHRQMSQNLLLHDRSF